jgi:hypothetical protein
MQICPKCKGEGKVFSKMSLLLTVGLPLAYLTQSQEKELTHVDCERCDGAGFTGGGTGGCNHHEPSIKGNKLCYPTT